MYTDQNVWEWGLSLIDHLQARLCGYHGLLSGLLVFVLNELEKKGCMPLVTLS